MMMIPLDWNILEINIMISFNMMIMVKKKTASTDVSTFDSKDNRYKHKENDKG
jgi:hypothetical protein